MTDQKVKRTGILPSDIDPAGNVTLWDHGPGAFVPLEHEREDVRTERARRHTDDVRQWHEANGDGPVAVVMYSSDAGHALMTDPDRYSVEPADLDEGEIKKRMDEMREKREAAANAPQYAIDRRIAIAAIVSDRAHAKSIEKSDAPKPAPKPFFAAPVPKVDPKPEPAKEIT